MTWVKSGGYEQRGLPPPPPSPSLYKLFLSARALITVHKGSHISIIYNNQYETQRPSLYLELWSSLSEFGSIHLVGPQDIKVFDAVL